MSGAEPGAPGYTYNIKSIYIYIYGPGPRARALPGDMSYFFENASALEDIF